MVSSLGEDRIIGDYLTVVEVVKAMADQHIPIPRPFTYQHAKSITFPTLKLIVSHLNKQDQRGL